MRGWLIVDTALGWIPLVFASGVLAAVGMPLPSEEAALAWAKAQGAQGPEGGEGALASTLRRYARGEPQDFSWVTIWWEGMSPFYSRVLQEVRAIPWGCTRTYQWLAERVGIPKGARAVGQVLARNPCPIVIPCHRIVGKDGSLKGYSGGLDWKRKLLALEGSLASPHLSPTFQERTKPIHQVRAEAGLR